MAGTPSSEQLRLLEQHFKAEYKSMISFASRVLDSSSLAETAVQDTFVCALEHMDKLTASENPVGWLYNTLKNIIRHMRRDERTLLRRVVQMEAASELDISVSDCYDTSFLGGEVDPDLRLLVQFYLHGYTLKELAAREGISIGAMKMRLKRSREAVKRKYHLSL